MDWHKSAKAYLERLGMGEYQQQLSHHLKSGRKKRTFRYYPSQYHMDLIDCLNENNEETFKAIKLLQGYASAIEV